MIGGKPAGTLHDTAEGEASARIDAVELAVAERDTFEDEDDYSPEDRGATWLPAALAGVAIVAWLALAAWLLLPALGTRLAPVAIVQLISALCIPPALIGILYLLALRTSRAEAQRFGASAAAMRAESAALERTLAMLSQRIDENRAALAEQSAMLVQVGDRAADRIDHVATIVARQAKSLDASTGGLSDAAAEAERRVEIVLTSLPKAHDEMRGMAERIDSAGLLAGQRAASLDAQLVALAERGREADRIAGGGAERLAAHIARMEATSETASARLEQVTDQMSVEVDEVLDRTAQAVDQARRGIAAQGEAILAMLSANQAALDRAGRDSAAALDERIAAIEQAIGRIGARLGEEQERGEALFVGISGGVDRVDRELQVLHAAGLDRTKTLSEAVRALHGSVESMSEAMKRGNSLAEDVIGTSETLLIALDASAREIDETLPAALQRLDGKIDASRKLVSAAKPELLALVTAAEGTHDAIEAIADVVAQQRDTLARTQATLLDTLMAGSERAETIGATLEQAIATTEAFAETAAPQLIEALMRVRETASAAAEHAREAMTGIVPQASAALGQASDAAIRRAIDDTVRAQIAELAETTEATVTTAARASQRLAEEMRALADTGLKLESDYEAMRAERERDDSDGFARRMSLLVEALNSSAIDIVRAFSVDVADSAWAAYLKGDRGVFTRRAVRLLDHGETREVLALYDNDAGFQDNVNRYIHDFEAMLRQVLALRDGSALGVTMLSSDAGKLYVALAQAIERLRT